MITTQDQEALFKLIADYLEEDLSCIAIGGTAMMLKGYKNTTKDIDVVFESIRQRDVFIRAIRELGYKERTLGLVYDKKRIEHQDKPVMYSRGEERFDLFVKKVFGFRVTYELTEVEVRVDVLGKKEMRVHVLSDESLILLKAITGREKDYEDIETIMSVKKNIDWRKLITQAIEQASCNEWILIDLEETMQKLKNKFFIKQEHFKKLYDAEQLFRKK